LRQNYYSNKLHLKKTPMNTKYFYLLPALALCSGRAHSQVVIFPMPAQQLLYDAQTRLLYASIGSKGGEYANSIIAIDPTAGRISKSVPTATEPGAIGLSERSKYLFAAVGESKQIRRFDLPGLTPGPTFPVIEGGTARNLLPADAPESVLMILNRNGLVSSIVYDNEVPRRLGHAPVGKLVQGIHPNLFYGADSSADLVGLLLTERGTALRFNARGLTGGGLQSSANGLLYYRDGVAIDPETQQVVGKFPELSGVYCADPESATVYAISGNGDTFKLDRYDSTTYRKIDTITIVKIATSGSPNEIVTCGPGNLAFRVGEKIVLLKGARRPLVDSTDLEVTRTALPTRLPRDGRWSYTLTVTNRGKIAASAVALSDQLQGENLVEETKASQGTALVATSVIRADLGTLAPGATATVTVKLASRDLPSFGGISVVRSAEPDSNPLNNLQYQPQTLPVLPDLTPKFEGIQQVSQGAGVNLEVGLAANVVVQNRGGGSSQPCLARFYVSDDANFMAEFATLLQDVQVPAIKAGESYRIQLRAPLGNGGDLTGMFLHVVIDPQDRMKEEVKINNLASGRIR
jgi:Domain of unknown function DUF11/CARDB